jgi:ketosteroid isomerase-like protein
MDDMMSDDLHDFEQFMQRRDEAARAYVNGDPELLNHIATTNSPATFFSPRGDFVQGATEVSARYDADATAFDSNSENTMQILQIGVSDGIAYWVGFQRASVHLKGRAEVVPFNLRVTELFRREGGEWKLVHRHADELKSAAET